MDNHTGCSIGPHDVSKILGSVRAPYFYTRTVFLRFRAGRRPVDCLAGAVLATTDQMAHNEVFAGKYNTKVDSQVSSGPVRRTTDIPKPVYGISTVHAYIIVFPSAFEIHRNPYMNLREPFRVRIRYLAILWSKNTQRTHRTPICM